MPQRVCGSRAPKGSSMRITRGPLISVRAIATRCFMPPERSFGYRSAKSARPTALRYLSDLSRRSAAAIPCSFRPYSTLSRTLSQPKEV